MLNHEKPLEMGLDLQKVQKKKNKNKNLLSHFLREKNP